MRHSGRVCRHAIRTWSSNAFDRRHGDLDYLAWSQPDYGDVERPTGDRGVWNEADVRCPRRRCFGGPCAVSRRNGGLRLTSHEHDDQCQPSGGAESHAHGSKATATWENDAVDILGLIVIGVLVFASVAALVLWLRGGGQPVVLRDGAGHVIDPDTLEPGETDDLPVTARDNRYIRAPRFFPWYTGRWGRVPSDPDYLAMRERERLTPRMPTDKRD